MKTYTYCGKIIKTPGDLQPKGIRSTYNTEKLELNEIYQHIWKLINTLK